jgi:two-component system chemotaxis response regulator CheY
MKHCLIADDSAVIRKVLHRILDGMEFRVSEAEDGDQALAACLEDMPDLVILDCHVPGLDSHAFLRALRRAPEGSKPKVVLCTAENDVALIARARLAGADEFLLKPFEKGHVGAALREVGFA